MLAKKAGVDRVYLQCQEGGRSLMNLEKRIQSHSDRMTSPMIMARQPLGRLNS